MSKQWTEEEVLKVMDIMRTLDVQSLSTPIGKGDEKDFELGDIIVDNGPGPQELVEHADMIRILNKALTYLKPREQLIIQMRYGLKDGVFRTLDECGEHFGVTRERIRQVEMKAMKKLKWVIKCKFKLRRCDL